MTNIHLFAVVLVLFLSSPSFPFLMMKMQTQESAIFTRTLPKSYFSQTEDMENQFTRRSFPELQSIWVTRKNIMGATNLLKLWPAELVI